MIQFKQIPEKAREAYENGELYEFLTGQKGYNYPCPDAQVNVMTDWTRIIPNGIYPLYEENNDRGVIAKYEEAILQMCTNREWAMGVWAAAHIIFTQLSNEMEGKSPFRIKNEVIHVFSEAIETRDQELESIYPYVPAYVLKKRKPGDGESAAADIRRLNAIFRRHYGYGCFDSRECILGRNNANIRSGNNNRKSDLP